MNALDRIRGRAEERARGHYRGFEHVRRGMCFVQGDQNIANQAGAAFRGDLNNELQALATLSSGTSAPGTTYAHEWWADTTNNLLKKRNAANSAWIVVRTLDETFQIARSSNTILGSSDVGKQFVATGSFTQTLTAAATLGDGWYVYYRNDGAGTIVLDPNASEQIDGATTLSLFPGDACFISCNGSAFKTFGLPHSAIGFQNFAASGTFTAPANTKSTTVFKFTVVGGGGSGAGSGASGASGGGGNPAATAIYYASALSAGSTVAVTVGTGGAAPTAGANNGLTGGDSSIVVGATTITAHGGLGGNASGTTAAANANSASSATNGSFNIPGGQGKIGGAYLATAIPDGGHGGGSSLGDGGAGGPAANNGQAATVPGSGGGGAGADSGVNRAGGAGKDGVVIVEWVI